MKSTTYPEVGWMKERFQMLTLNDKTCEFDMTMQPGSSVPLHFHKESDELFKVLEGEVTFKVDGKTILAHAGDEVLVPKMIMHGISNQSEGNIKCRVTYSPVSDQGKFFKILFFLENEKPNDKNALFKAMYISDRLDYKEFSTVTGGMKVMMNIMMACFILFAPLTGWNKLVRKYAKANLVS